MDFQIKVVVVVVQAVTAVGLAQELHQQGPTQDQGQGGHGSDQARASHGGTPIGTINVGGRRRKDLGVR
jgi:hypothetical protein